MLLFLDHYLTASRINTIKKKEKKLDWARKIRESFKTAREEINLI